MTHNRRLVLQGMLAGALLPLSAPGWARMRPVPMELEWANAQPFLRTPRLEVSVLRQAGRDPFPVFTGSDGSAYVGGTLGAAYRLRVRNLTGQRLLVVPSVDGLNAITGQVAHPGQSGYIVAAYGEVIIDGWRKSMLEVARFEFSTPSGAYASQVGKHSNVGVIGFALFDERPTKVLSMDYEDVSRGEFAPGGAHAKSASRMAAEPASAPTLGTAHGARSQSSAVRGEFERASDRPLEIVRLRYDTIESLELKGIAKRASRGEPDPFPGFVPDPPRHR